jgi:hypothetical protein
MSFHKSNSRDLLVTFAAIPLLAGAFSAVAQVSPVGTMQYAPSIACAVPIGGSVFLMILGVFLGAIAYRKIARNGRAGNVAASLLLAMGQ